MSRFLAAWCLLAMLTPLAAGESADPWTRFDAANRLAATDPAGARTALEALLLDHPALYAASYNLGCLLLTDDAEGAARRFTAATASPQAELAAAAWHNLALAHQQLGRLNEALAAATKAVAQAPQDADLLATRDELRRLVLAAHDEARRQAEEAAKKLAIATTALPPARVGEPYDQAVAARGGTAPYRFTLGGDAKAPPGLTLDADGRLHGTPGEPGTVALTVVVQDAAAPTPATADGKLSLTILPPPAILTHELPEAIVGIDYRADLRATGLTRPRWTVTGLPPGLRVADSPDGSAVISGSPTAPGDAVLVVRAADAERGADASIPLAVTDLFAPSERVLPPATAWAAYEHRLIVRGPAQDYRWKQDAPVSGIAIAADGAVSGAPAQAGDLVLPLTITAQDGRTRAVQVTLPVNAPPVIELGERIDLRRGSIADQALKVDGGTPPYRWSLAEGLLPTGVRLDPDGHLRGAASETGAFAVTIQCADRWSATTQAKATVQVEDPPKDQPKPPEQQKDDTAKKDDEGKDQQKDDQKPGQHDQAGSPDQAKNDQKKDDPNQSRGQPKPDDQGQSGKDDQKPGGDQAQQQPKNGGDQNQQPQPKPGGDQAQQQPKPDGGKKQDGQPGSQGDQRDQTQHGAPSADQATDAQQQARALTDAAAARWLEQLPAEDRSGLRTQLLLDGHVQPSRTDQTW